MEEEETAEQHQRTPLLLATYTAITYQVAFISCSSLSVCSQRSSFSGFLVSRYIQLQASNALGRLHLLATSPPRPLLRTGRLIFLLDYSVDQYGMLIFSFSFSLITCRPSVARALLATGAHVRSDCRGAGSSIDGGMEPVGVCLVAWSLSVNPYLPNLRYIRWCYGARHPAGWLDGPREMHLVVFEPQC